MSAAIGLDPLLTALREAGLTVGVSEMARLQQVFALGPQLAAHEEHRLKAVLRAVLVKSSEDRAIFDPLFDAWFGGPGLAGLDKEMQALISQLDTVIQARKRDLSSAWRWVAVAALAVAILIPLGYMLFRRQVATPLKLIPATTPKTTPVEPAPPPTPRASTAEKIRETNFVTWVPILTVTPSDPAWKGWPALSLGSLSLLAAGGLWFGTRKRSWLPEPAPEPVKKGPPRVFLTPPQLAGPQFLEPREQEALVWGIGHFVADEPTPKLDLPATVRATVRDAGVPHLLFHRARHSREVWLWIDEAADDPSVPRLAAEIEAALKAHGLPVELALFRGFPDWLVTSAGQAFAPNEVDERRDAALVAILTDGRALARQYAADDRRVKLDALLRSLSHWPQLVFVDFAAEPGELSGILKRHSLLRTTPPGLAAFLGSTETAKRKPSLATSGDTAWIAALAVAPASVDESSAFRLRRRLGLTTSPWALRTLRAEAPGPPGRFQWQPQDRARRVNWLRNAEARAENGIAPESLLGKTLDFWEEVYDRELKERSSRAEEGVWEDTPAHQHLVMERSLLGLWRDASKAIRDLYRLHGGALRELIEQHLSQMAPLDGGGSEFLHLPWLWAERSGAEQVMLGAMKLGGGVPAATLRRPSRLLLGLGLCLGLAAGAITAAALSGRRPPEGPPSVVHGPGKPADAFQEITRAPTGRWRLTVATMKTRVVQEVPAGSIVQVRWAGVDVPCRPGELLEEGGMTFVHICPGTFTMGSADDDPQAYPDEHPAHEVTLSEFWIGRTEVTNAQYHGTAPPSLPATDVSWYEAKKFCESYGWRLPTEAEWEYTARAGTRTSWSFGTDEKQLGDFAWYAENSNRQPHPVGTKRPSPWGLYDMHGSVWEWVEDWYGTYSLAPQRDPKGPASGTYRVLRGGAFASTPRNLRSALRIKYRPSFRYSFIGFRCARSPRRQP